MTVAQEIAFLKDQLYCNQRQYARCMEESDRIAMDFLATRNRELIDRLHEIEALNSRQFEFDGEDKSSMR